jgi:transcription termination/antitermination protein NusG
VDEQSKNPEVNETSTAPEESSHSILPVNDTRPETEPEGRSPGEDTLAVAVMEASASEAPTMEAPKASEDPAPAESLPVVAPPAEGAKRAWYVVHCYSGYENKVKKSLEQRISNMDVEGLIFRIIVPTEEEIDVREGQRKVIQRRVFPGYVLVEMMQYDPENPDSKRAWYVVRNTPGVTGFVSSGDIPTPLREDEVGKILKRMETDQPKVRVTYRKGQSVHIIDGPFADFRGTVDEVNMEKGKVRVMVSFFGRETPIELDLLQVEKV